MAYSSPRRQSRIYDVLRRYGAFVATLAVAGVPEVGELYVLEGLEGFLGGALEDDDLGDYVGYLEGAHEVGCVSALGAIGRGVVVEVVLLVLLPVEELLQLGEVLPGLAEAERAEVRIERAVHEILG